MTLFIIGFALLLGLIITLEVKSRKREKENDQRYFDITKNALGNQLIKFEERMQNSQDCLEDAIYRKFAMLYAKGIDSVATIRLKEAKEKGYFDRIFFFEGAEHEFYRFDVIKDNEITIIASPMAPSINKPFKRITIFKNGLFTALDFVKDEQSIDIFSIQTRLEKIVDDLRKSLLKSDSFEGSVKASEKLKVLLNELRKTNHEKTN